MALKVRQEFPLRLIFVHAWLFPVDVICETEPSERNLECVFVAQHINFIFPQKRDLGPQKASTGKCPTSPRNSACPVKESRNANWGVNLLADGNCQSR